MQPGAGGGKIQKKAKSGGAASSSARIRNAQVGIQADQADDMIVDQNEDDPLDDLLAD